jgi:hypothetical protein
MVIRLQNTPTETENRPSNFSLVAKEKKTREVSNQEITHTQTTNT